MPVLDSTKTENALLRKGFTKKEGDHHRFEFWHNGKLTRSNTKISHNGQDLNDYLIGKMSKQINLKKPEFMAFVQCTLDQKKYIKILQEKGFIEKDNLEEK